MSYILDALKKSDQERQQGDSPNLHSVHGVILPVQDSSPFTLHHAVWLLAGLVVLLIVCLGVLFFQFNVHFADKDPVKMAENPLVSAKSQPSPVATSKQPSDQVTHGDTTSSPSVVVKDNNKVLLSIAVKKGPSEPPVAAGEEASEKSLPLLQDLSPELRAEIPDFKFAGHTYAGDPSQRMIIVNGKILREGDMIAPHTHLAEISWEGVVIQYNGILFRVKTE